MNFAAAANLRERKKSETRRRIVAAGRALFAAHGFDRVTVAQVAAGAGVSAKTVCNYFPAKEEIFFVDHPSVGGDLVEVVRGRASGESVYDAVRRYAATPAGILQAVLRRPSGESVYDAIRRFRSQLPDPVTRRVYAGSAALQAYVRERFAELERELAAQLTQEAAAPDVEAPAGLDTEVPAGPAAAPTGPDAAASTGLDTEAPTGPDTGIPPGPEAGVDAWPSVVAAALVAPLRWRFSARFGGLPDPPIAPAYDLLAPALADYLRRR